MMGQALRLGAWRALPAALAPLASDGPVIAAVLLVLARAPGWLLRGLHCGGLFLLWIAWGTLRAAARPARADAPGPGPGGGFAHAVAMNALSPGPWICWSTVSGPILVEAWRDSAASAFAFLAGFYLLRCGGNAALVLLFAGARRLGPRVALGLGLASAAVMLGFGIHQIARGLLG